MESSKLLPKNIDNNAIIPNKEFKTINLYELSVNPLLKNSDLILAIIEITDEFEIYTNYEGSKLTDSFWLYIIKSDKFSSIFSRYKASTLKKYHKKIRNIPNLEMLKEIVNNNSGIINNPEYKLMTVIDSLSSFFVFMDNANGNFPLFLKNFVSKKRIILSSEDNNNGKININLLKRKRHNII